MDLVSSGGRVVVTMTHTSKAGAPKILPACNLPLTGKAVVDLIITELAVFACRPPPAQGSPGGARELVLIEHAEGVSVEEIRAKTAAPFVVSPDLKPMLQ